MAVEKITEVTLTKHVMVSGVKRAPGDVLSVGKKSEQNDFDLSTDEAEDLIRRERAVKGKPAAKREAK